MRHTNIDDAPYKFESLAILNYCLENYDANYYIIDHLERISLPKEETNVLQDSMEEEIAEPESPLDENEEESDEQKEEEWSHPCLPSNDSNSLTLTLYDECYDPMDSFEMSLFDEVDAFYTYGLDATMDDAYKDELAIVPYDKHEIVTVAPTLDCPIILLKSPTISENFALIKAQCDGLHLSYHPKNRVENNTRVLAGHEQHDLCDGHILDVVHDATENYFQRGKFGCRNFHVTKTP